MNISWRVYRDTPKAGESDAKWCVVLTSANGHVHEVFTGFETKAEAEIKADAYLTYCNSF